MKPTRAQAEEAVRQLIAYLGDDPSRAGVLDTPARFLRAWEKDWGKGYGPPPVLSLFPEGDRKFDQLVIVKDLTFHSHCEHHLAPFYGTAHICYFPDPARGLVGLSKFARVVDHFSRRLQVQERLTEEIADFLVEHAAPDVGVILKGVHMCMVSRGVHQSHSNTTTSAMRGKLLYVPEARAEFLKLTT